jgi:hypothetical protein
LLSSEHGAPSLSLNISPCLMLTRHAAYSLFGSVRNG